MSNEDTLIPGSRRILSRAASRIIDLEILRDEWSVSQTGNSDSDMGVLGQELLSSMHAVQASLLEIEPVYSAVTVADVKKELERLLTESHVSPEQRSKMLAKFDAATASHERWDGLLKSFGEALDKGTNSIHEKLRKPVVRAAGSGGESWCCAAGWSVIGIGWKLKSKKIVEWGEDIVERCC